MRFKKGKCNKPVCVEWSAMLRCRSLWASFVFISFFCHLSPALKLKKVIGQALMGDWLSTLPSRFHCIGSGNNFTNFMLFSRIHPTNHRPLHPYNRELLHKSDFDPSIPTKIIIHGFVDNIFISDWMQRMKDNFLSEGDYNVMIVDWSCGNEFPYFQAMQRSKIVAEKLKDLITFIMDSTGAKPSSFHLIGHSLGSHIAGRVGHAIPHLNRISGLDPAGPRFFDVPLEDRLDPSDADFVDVIHTDSGNGLLEGLGMRMAVGHVDFYPNGGSTQPGCHNSPFSILPRIGIHRAGRYYLTCDHFRSIELYVESIKPVTLLRSAADDSACAPVGVVCRDWETFEQGRCADCSHTGDCAVMGYHSDLFFDGQRKDTYRQLYLKTADEKPFCLFQYQVIVETACDFGSCDSEKQPSFNPGVIRLETQVKNGKIARLVLDDDSEQPMKPGAQYVYLATSRFPIGDIEGAKIWWGYASRPEAEAGPSPYLSGLNLKSVQINPITSINSISRLSDSEISVLCAPPNRTIGRNQYLELSQDYC